MLAAELALRLEPLLEEVRMGLDDLEVLERDIMEALGL